MALNPFDSPKKEIHKINNQQMNTQKTPVYLSNKEKLVFDSRKKTVSG
jgi:hypothetical protein